MSADFPPPALAGRPPELPGGRRLPSLAIVIPVYNEAGNVAALLARLARLRAHELVIVDGGSSDGSADALQAGGQRVLAGPRGRARQMNLGAAATAAEVLLFLHADTTLDPQHAEAVQAAGGAWDRLWLLRGAHRLGRSAAAAG